MKECHLFASLILFLLSKEDLSPIYVALEYSLYKSTTFQNSLIVPLYFEHPPVLLNINCCLSLLLSVLLGLTK